MKTLHFSKIVAGFIFTAIVAMTFVLSISTAQAGGWDKTGVKDSGVTYYDSNSSGTYLQTAISGGSYNNVASPDGIVTSGWDSSTVQAGVAYGCSIGNCQLKESSDGTSLYLITNIFDWF